MNNKEKIIELLDTVPDYKIGYVLAYLQGITAEEVAPDGEELQAIKAYLDKDSEYSPSITQEDLTKDLEL